MERAEVEKLIWIPAKPLEPNQPVWYLYPREFVITPESPSPPFARKQIGVRYDGSGRVVSAELKDVD